MRIPMMILALATLPTLSAFAAKDLYPNIPATTGAVKSEYNMAKAAFEHGNHGAPAVLQGLNPGAIQCTYYRQDGERKDSVAFTVGKGPLGKTARTISLLGTQIALNHGDKDNGPSASLDVREGDDTMRYVAEVRLTVGDDVGSFIVSVVAGRNPIERTFDTPQYIVCPLN